MVDDNTITPMVNNQRAYVTQPSYIRVKCRSTDKYNGKTNYEYWGIGYGDVAEVPYADYIRDVLPNEWDSDKVSLKH